MGNNIDNGADPYLEEFRECNEHLRETDRKRDQLIAFYALVVGVFFAAMDSLNYLEIIFAITLTFLGVILTVTLIHYRMWHIRYVNTAHLLRHLSHQSNKDREEIIDQELRFVYGDLYKQGTSSISIQLWLKRYFSGVEFLTFCAFLIVSFLPLYVLIESAGVGNPFGLDRESVFVVDLLLYVSFFNIIALIKLLNVVNNSPWATWLLRDFETDEPGSSCVIDDPDQAVNEDDLAGNT